MDGISAEIGTQIDEIISNVKPPPPMPNDALHHCLKTSGTSSEARSFLPYRNIWTAARTKSNTFWHAAHNTENFRPAQLSPTTLAPPYRINDKQHGRMDFNQFNYTSSIYRIDDEQHKLRMKFMAQSKLTPFFDARLIDDFFLIWDHSEPNFMISLLSSISSTRI